MYAGAPVKIHTIAIDYWGYGTSSGVPSEDGLLRDALTLADWAMNVAQIPPILFGGMVLVAPFADVETLTATYRVGGTIPILSPVADFPEVLNFFDTFIVSKWPNKDTLAHFVQTCETRRGEGFKYHITLIHAEDDYDVPWPHSEIMFWHAVNASLPMGISYEELEKEKESLKRPLGAGGWVVKKRSDHGVIREEIVKYGLHDKIMSYPVVSLAVLRAFRGAEEFAPILE